jgi:hypothetical protein
VKFEQFTYPSYEAPLVKAYGGRFESVFVVLHPFLRVPEELAWKTTKQYPSDEQIVARGEKCTWAEVAVRTGLRNCAKLNHAMLTSIRAINDEVCDFAAGAVLQGFLESEAVWVPGEGRFEPLLQDGFLRGFESAGWDEFLFVPEFPNVDPIERLGVAKIKSREVRFPPRGSLVAPDASFLFTVDWDSFFTLFYGPREFISDVVAECGLEGFFAGTTTEHFWFHYQMGCATVTISPEHWPAF